MAANLKIGIIADDGDAQKKFEGLSTSVDMTAKSVDQLRNMMAKLTVENLKLTNDIKSMQKGTQEYVQAVNELEHIQDVLARTTKQYDNAVQRLGLSYQTGTDSLKNYRQELKMLQSQYQKAMAQGQGTGFSSEDMQNLELLTSKIDTVTQKIKELEKAEKERAEIAAKNNSLAQFQNSIEQANIQGILQKQKALKELTAAIAKANLQQEQYNKNALANFQNSVEQADIQNILTKEKALKEFALTLQKANLQQEQYDIKKSNEAAEAKRNSLLEVQNALEKAGIQNILTKEKALKDFTATLQKANLQQQQYNAQAVNNFSSGAMSTASGQTTEYLAQGLLGNTASQLKSNYDAYYQQLLKVISLYGVESSEARRVATVLGDLNSEIERAASAEKKQAEQQALNTAKYKERRKALDDFTEAVKKANAQQVQYNAEALKTFSSGSAGTATSQQTEYLAQGLLKDKVGQLKSTYNAYYQQLLKIIPLYGTESKEAQELAQRLTRLDKRISSLSASTTSAATRIKNLVKNFVSAQMIVWAIRKAFTSLVSTLKESAEAAAEAEETYNLFITTFETVATTAEATANRLANSLGMATSTAQEALGTFGDLAAGYGATDKEALEFGETATQVAMDIISYKNISGDTATTLQSIASGLAGNVENFRKLGYVMTQAEVKEKLQKKGLDKLTGSAKQYAQIQARLEILQEKSTKAQGDMQKTLNSTTNVTRRLSEAWLEYKENLGKGINNVFSPIKKWWLSILEATNKAIKAKEEFLKTGSNADVFDASENDDDYKAFVKAMKSASRAQASGGIEENSINNLNSKNKEKYAVAFENLKTLVGTYNATAEQVKYLLQENTNYSDDLIEKIYTEIKTWKEENDTEVKNKEEWEETKNSKISRLNSAITLIDTLSELNEGRIVDTSALSTLLTNLNNTTYGIPTGTQFEQATAKKANRINYDKEIETTSHSLIDKILKSFAEADTINFAEGIDVAINAALGESSLDSALENQLEAAKDIYEALWNDFLTDGETTVEQLRKALENVKNVQEKITQREEWGKAIDDAIDVFKDAWEITWKSLTAAGRIGFEAPVMGAVKFVQGGVSGAKESKDNGEGILGNIWGFIKGSFSSVWDYIKQLFSDLLEPLVKFITESDAFQELMTVLSDSVLPAINAALEPFLPLLKMFAYFLQNVVLPILYELFPVIKAIAVVFGYVMAVVGTAVKFISDGVKWLVGTVVGGIEDMINGVIDILNCIPFVDIGHVDWGLDDDWKNIDVFGNAKKTWEDMCGYVEEIKDCTMNIEKNTSEDEMDLTVLNKLFESGVIDWDEMNALRASFLGQATPEKQTQLIAANAGDYATYLRSGGTTTISYGGITVEINSESGDPEEIADTVIRKMKEQLRNGRSEWSSATA